MKVGNAPHVSDFPVVLAADRAVLQPVLDELADRMATAFRTEQASLAEAFRHTSLPAREEPLEALLHYLFVSATRMARERLEAAGTLPPWPDHDDGSRWEWWAEEAEETEVE